MNRRQAIGSVIAAGLGLSVGVRASDNDGYVFKSTFIHKDGSVSKIFEKEKLTTMYSNAFDLKKRITVLDMRTLEPLACHGPVKVRERYMVSPDGKKRMLSVIESGQTLEGYWLEKGQLLTKGFVKV